jgi:hypothetical protein
MPLAMDLKMESREQVITSCHPGGLVAPLVALASF